LWFESHEWSKHGICAGAIDADDFFAQVCALSDAPLAVMATQEAGGMQAMVSAVKADGFPVFSVDEFNDQIELSACAGADGRWKLSAPSSFASVCGVSNSATAPPLTTTGHSSAACWPNRQGPPCRVDSECAGISGCARCAHSGYCTDVPLVTEGVCHIGRHGPRCHGDTDCVGVFNCLRCARSGYCTAVPLETLAGKEALHLATPVASCAFAVLIVFGLVAARMTLRWFPIANQHDDVERYVSIT